MASGCWWYYFSKFTEFFDTIFFVMRKRYDQVSTLHVIHHGIMPVSVWWGVKFTPGGHSSFFGFLNTFVHIIMYTYYMLAAMGPKVQKYLWWKKYEQFSKWISNEFVLVWSHIDEYITNQMFSISIVCHPQVLDCPSNGKCHWHSISKHWQIQWWHLTLNSLRLLASRRKEWD